MSQTDASFKASPPPAPGLPSLAELGPELLTTDRRQRFWSLSRPFLLIVAFAVAWRVGLWWMTPAIVFLLFVSIVTVTHDVVHDALGLSSAQTDWWLFILGAMLLESGHAYRITHRQHHRVFPGPDDPEGDPARMTFVNAILWGPLFLPRLWLWAFARGTNQPAQRTWLIAEAAWALAFVIAAVSVWSRSKAPATYAGLVVVGSWVYPLLTVYLPHHGYGPTPLSQTGTLRGIIIPRLFLELTYHLEHHLYPGVPSHHLAKLSRLIDPTLRAQGVQPRRVI